MIDKERLDDKMNNYIKWCYSQNCKSKTKNPKDKRCPSCKRKMKGILRIYRILKIPILKN